MQSYDEITVCANNFQKNYVLVSILLIYVIRTLVNRANMVQMWYHEERLTLAYNFLYRKA